MRYRINLEFSPEVEERLVHLQTLSRSTNRTEVFRRALAVFELVLMHQEETGGRILLSHPDGETETLLLVL